MDDQSVRTTPTEIDPLSRQAIRRAAEIGIDPRRVVLALGLPLRLLDGLDEEARPGPTP